MADAWARVTGEVGVATVHQGPGFTNALTGLAEAAKSRTPLVVLASDTSAAAVRSNFRVDQAAMAARSAPCPIGPHAGHRPGRRGASVPACRPGAAHGGAHAAARRPGRGRWRGRRACGRGGAGDPHAAGPRGGGGRRRPAGGRPAPGDRGGPGCGPRRRPPAAGGPGGPDRGPARHLGAGQRPVRGQPLRLGISGGFASPIAAELLREADLVLAAGASLNMWTTRTAA